MAKVNFKQQKRQKELARKSRQEQKQLKRTAQPGAADAAAQSDPDQANPNQATPADVPAMTTDTATR